MSHSSSDFDPEEHELAIPEEDHEHVDHIDEKWLVSYADMMTLLFGLFVMLYSIAMETQGRPDEYIAEIAVTEKSKDGPPPKTGQDVASDPKGRVILTEETVPKEQRDRLQAELEQLKEKMKTMIEAPSIDLAQYTALQEELRNTKEELENLKLKVRMTSTGPSVDLIEYEKTKADLKRALAQLAQLQDKLKEVPENLPKGPVVAEAEFLKLNAELEDLRKKWAELLADMKRKEEELAKLKAQVPPPAEKPSSFLVLSLNWESERHDLDLIVTDPEGLRYTFDNREDKAKTSRLMLDSRTGPGAELWQTRLIKPGQYKVEVVFYNNYGNDKPAKIQLMALSNLREYKIDHFELDFSLQKKRTFQIQVASTGEVKVLSADPVKSSPKPSLAKESVEGSPSASPAAVKPSRKRSADKTSEP